MVFSWSLKVGAWLFLFSTRHTGAERYVVDLDLQRDAVGHRKGEDDYGAAGRAAKILFQEGNKVCGGEEIKQKLSVQKDAGLVRATSWSSIQAIADAYIKKQDEAIPILKKQKESLEAQWKAKTESEKTKEMPAEAIETVLMAALTTGYGGLDNAKVTCCGAADRKIKKPLGVDTKSMPNTKTAFKDVVTTEIQKGFRYTTFAIHEACKAKLITDVPPCGQRGTYCTELCPQLSRIATDVSDEVNGAQMAGESADDLLRKFEAKKVELEEAEKELRECKESKEHLGAFSKQLEDCNTDIEKKHTIMRNAHEALDNAEGFVEQLSDLVGEQQKKMSQVKRLLAAKQVDVQEDKKKLAQVRAMEFGLKAKRRVTTRKINEAKQAMDELQDAQTAAIRMKGHATALALGIDEFINMGVREPLRDMGFTSDFKVEDVFEDSPETLKKFTEAFVAVDKQCKEDAGKIAAVRDYVDLSPVCNLGGEQEATAGVQAAVQNWIKLLNEKLQAAVNLVVEYQVEEDPDHVPSMAGIMGDDPLYVTYLKKWEAGGTFETLIAKTGELMAAMEAKYKEALQAMEGLAKKLATNLAESTAQRMVIINKMKEGAALGDSLDKVKALLASNEEAQKKAEANIDALEAAAREAEKNLEESRANLKDVFDVGTGKKGIGGLVQLLFKAHKDRQRFAALHEKIAVSGLVSKHM